MLAQVYVERQNGFAPTKDNKYGTTPMSYRVQVRFPFGLETSLGQDEVFLPPGEFFQALQPYDNKVKVCDDVQRDFEFAQIVLGPKVQKTRNLDGSITISCSPKGESITFPYTEETGKGYQRSFGTDEYYFLEDYNLRLKMAGTAPLFYSATKKPRIGIVRHDPYAGFTQYQSHQFEAHGGSEQRKKAYDDYIKHLNEQIVTTEAGARWERSTHKASSEEYLFDITLVNGITLFTKTGLPVTRLRDYQLELFQSCLRFIDSVNTHNRTHPLQKGLSGSISMGVGSGKTFFTFTLLQHLRQTMQNHPSVWPLPSA